MTEEQYKYLNQMIENGKISRTAKKKDEKETNYAFITKPNEQNVANKYVFKIPNFDESMIERIDNLILKQRVIQKNKLIRNLSITVGAIAGFVIITGGMLKTSKNIDAQRSIMNEAQSRVEQLEKKYGVEFNSSTTQQIYNEVKEERKSALESYDNEISKKQQEIEELKRAKEQLEQSYYEVTNENAKSK